LPKILRVLQIQNSATEADAILHLLTQAGHTVSPSRVQTAGELTDALSRSEWDVVVADYRLPSFDAAEALAIMNAANRDLPFIGIFERACEGIAMMRAGARDCLTRDQFDQLPFVAAREIQAARERFRKRHEDEETRESRDRVLLAMQATRLGIFDFCPQSGRLILSDPLKDIYGISPGTDCSWKVFLEKIHPDDRALVRQMVIEAMRPESHGRFFGEHRAIGSPGGSPRAMIAWGNVIFSETGRPVRFLGAARDITERKRAAQSLQDQLLLTQRITQQSADSIFVLDVEGLVTFVNPEAERAFGFTAAEFLGQRLHDLLHHHYPDGRIFPGSECTKGHARIDGQILHDREDLFFHKDGTPIHISWSSAPLDVNGSRSGVVLTIRNIGERKRTEDALRQSEARYRCLDEAGIVGTLIADESGILQANEHFIRMLGYTREEFAAGKLNVLDITAPEFRELTSRVFQAGLESGSVVPYEKELLRKDGTKVPVMAGAVAIKHAGGRCLFGFIIDLTRRKNLENQLRQAQKLESVGRLAGGIAHDFNNLLTIILGYSEMISADLGGDAAALTRNRTRIAEIARAANQAGGLTRQLLTFSRQRPGAPKLICMDQVVREVTQMLGQLIGEDIEIILGLDAQARSIKADPGQIEQVLMNLAANARDAMPEGGKLCIETSSLLVDERFAALCLAAEPGQYVQLVVSDTGTGMPPEVVAHMFEPFFTTKDPGKGTGLGLATVYGIVKQSGGSLSVHSTPGLGTTFRMLFPEFESDRRVTPPLPVQIVANGHETILLVEDEAGVRGYVKDVLSLHGYHVIEAKNFGEAIASVTSYPGRIDLLLTDSMLPGGTGDGIVRRLAQLRPGIPSIVMSGYTGRIAPRLEDEQPFLQKPFPAADLLRLMRRVLDPKVAATSV